MIKNLTKCSTFWIIIWSFGVKKTSDTRLSIEPPAKRQKAFVEVCLHSPKQWVILSGIKEVLGGFGLLQFGGPRFLQAGEASESVGAEFGDLRSVEFADGEERVHLAEDARFVPLYPEPRRVPEHEVKAAARGEDIGEGEFPVEESQAGSCCFYCADTGKIFAELGDAKLPILIVQG